MKDSIDKPKRDSLWQKTQYANLIRYIPSGTYYARARIKGKLKVKSLETKSVTVAKMKLADFEKGERQKAERTNGREVEKMKFGDALELLRANGFRPIVPRHKKDKVKLKPKALDYYEQRVKALLKAWPTLEQTKVADVKQEQIEQWSQSFLADRSATAHNHTLGLIRNVLDIAVQRGVLYDNPAMRVIRATEKPKKLILPTPEQFDKFVTAIETAGSGFSKHCANLVRFLAYGGFRKDEAPHIAWQDCDFATGQIQVRGNPESGTKGTEEKIRNVPMIPEMRELLEKMRAERPHEPGSESVMKVGECQKAMDTACGKVKGMERITHHDLRHLFATRCIESGVDIPTISRWLGHSDGGALAMKVYGHLRDEHSTAMAAKVSFRKPANIVDLAKEAI